MPKNFGAEPNIDNSVYAGFECTTISGKLRAEKSFCLRRNQPDLFGAQAISNIQNVLDIGQSQMHV